MSVCMYVCMYLCSVASVAQLVTECVLRIEASGPLDQKFKYKMGTDVIPLGKVLTCNCLSL